MTTEKRFFRYFTELKTSGLNISKKLIFTHFQEWIKKAGIRNIKSLKTLLKQKETAIFESHFKNEI